MCLEVNDLDRVLGTYVFAPVRNTPAAGFRYADTVDRAFVACDIQHLDDIWIIRIAAHSELDAFVDNSTFLINAAPHGRFGAGHDFFGDL